MPSDVNSEMSAGSAMTNLGSNFLERLGQQASYGFGSALRRNPGGGGASEATDAPAFRMWGETYGISATNGAQGDFASDRRQTWGGVAGFGGRIAPGVNVGISVDQSHTAIDVPLALQSAGLDLTQFGFNASVDEGPWTWAIALVHGFGQINSTRDTGAGFAGAGYGAHIDGALTELSYYWSLDQSRIVPKAAFEYVRAVTGSFQEMGGLDPVAATGTTLERSRILVGAEIGHYWIIDQKNSRPVRLRQIRRQPHAGFLLDDRQPRSGEHHRAGHHREQVWCRCGRVRFAQPERYGASLCQL